MILYHLRVQYVISLRSTSMLDSSCKHVSYYTKYIGLHGTVAHSLLCRSPKRKHQKTVPRLESCKAQSRMRWSFVRRVNPSHALLSSMTDWRLTEGYVSKSEDELEPVEALLACAFCASSNIVLSTISAWVALERSRLSDPVRQGCPDW